jgi:hypothetical protein
MKGVSQIHAEFAALREPMTNLYSIHVNALEQFGISTKIGKYFSSPGTASLYSVTPAV